MVDKKLESITSNISNLKNAVVTPNDIRLALMDYDSKNIPLYKQHLTDEELWKCIYWAIDSFNEFPPKLQKTYSIITFPYKNLLKDLAVIEALKLTALIELRGEMQYNDGGIQSSVYYKSSAFSALRQELEQKTQQEIMSIKKSQNINGCYGALC